MSKAGAIFRRVPVGKPQTKRPQHTPVIVISTKGVARTEKSIRRRRRIVRFLHSLTLGRNDIYSAATFVTVEMTNAKYGIRLNGMRRRAYARRRIKILRKT